MNAEKVVRVLSLLEWSGMGTLKASCPWCWRWQKAGHRGDCGLDALLSEASVEMKEYEDKEEGES